MLQICVHFFFVAVRITQSPGFPEPEPSCVSLKSNQSKGIGETFKAELPEIERYSVPKAVTVFEALFPTKCKEST